VEIWRKNKKADGGGELKDVQWPQHTATGFGLDASTVERVRVGWFEDKRRRPLGFAGCGCGAPLLALNRNTN